MILFIYFCFVKNVRVLTYINIFPGAGGGRRSLDCLGCGRYPDCCVSHFFSRSSLALGPWFLGGVVGRGSPLTAVLPGLWSHRSRDGYHEFRCGCWSRLGALSGSRGFPLAGDDREYSRSCAPPPGPSGLGGGAQFSLWPA